VKGSLVTRRVVEQAAESTYPVTATAGIASTSGSGHLDSPASAKGVTYVPGTIRHLCLGSLKAVS